MATWCGSQPEPASTGDARSATVLALLALTIGVPAAPLAGQRLEVGAQGLLVWHHADRTPDRRSHSELQLVRAMAMGAWRLIPGAALRATLDFEGLTIPDGELSPGGWGEGFVDRRHPHAYFHELILEGHTGERCGRIRCRLGGYLGRGFVPFGSDDPMNRGFIRYPVNHHLAQILERAVVAGQASLGPALFEAALFNGDEPESPGQWPRISGRFGDSWALRLSVSPLAGVELRGSAAFVSSPEHRPGAGADQDKRHLAVSIDRSFGADRIDGMAEWARTSELDGFFVFESALAELAWRRARLDVRYRFERTDRPEEERLSSYRVARPHLENTILGITRWTTHTAAAAWNVRPRRTGLETLLRIEVTRGGIGESRPGAFDLIGTYGDDQFWMVSLGIEITVGRSGHRMGRYGLAAPHH